MDKCLFLFTLGPVQSFIREARKTRDLYAGSQLLSKLIRHAMGKFRSVFPEGEIIFPYYDPKDENVSYPNRFVAKVESNGGDLKSQGQKIEAAVREEWRRIAEEALRVADVRLSGYWREQYFRQIEDFLEIYWLFVPMSGDDYGSAYETLERMEGAIKNIRPFKQFVERGIKCSLDGRYNAIFFSPKKEPSKKLYEQGVRVRQQFLIGDNEGLSAVSFVKRCQKGTFPSTSTVALLEDCTRLNEDESKVIDCFRKLFKKEQIVPTCIELFRNGLLECAKLANPEEENDWCDDYDSHFLFEENLDKKSIPNNTQLKLLRELQSRLKDKLKTRYYAVVLFDGDHMGKWLSGELLNDAENTNLEEFHRELSKALSNYARWTRTYLNAKNRNGQVIYAGGDDFLGFVNVYHLFEVLRELRKNFDQKVNNALEDYLGEKQITFSAGVVVAHYKMPFSEVLKKVRAVEKKAKEEGNRNAFAIAVMKHSGEIQETVYKWDENPDSAVGTSNLDALEFAYQKIDSQQKKGDFSNTFVQVLTDELHTLLGRSLQGVGFLLDERDLEEPIIKAEVHRLVGRSYIEKKKDEQEIRTLSEKVWHLFQNAPRQNKAYPRHFVHALHIADFLNRKTTEQL